MAKHFDVTDSILRALLKVCGSGFQVEEITGAALEKIMADDGTVLEKNSVGSLLGKAFFASDNIVTRQKTDLKYKPYAYSPASLLLEGQWDTIRSLIKNHGKEEKAIADAKKEVKPDPDAHLFSPEFGKLQDQIGNLEEQLGRKIELVAELNKQSDGKQERIIALRKEIIGLKRNVDDFEGIVEYKQDQIDSLKKQLTKAQLPWYKRWFTKG